MRFRENRNCFRLALTLCLAYCANGVAAQALPVQVYGRLNLGVERVLGAVESTSQKTHVTRLSNYRSVLGVRGSEHLGNSLYLIYQVEGALAPDTGGGSIASRDTRIGLTGKLGTLFAGHWVTPYTSATAGLDPFGPTTAAYSSIMGNGSSPSSDNRIDTATFDRRQQNSLAYWSPDFYGTSVRIAHGFSEDLQTSLGRPSLTSISITHEIGPLYLVAAHERHHEYRSEGRADSGSKIGVAYRFGNTRIAVVGERLRYQTLAGDLSRKAAYVSLTHQIGQHSVRIAFARAFDASGVSNQTIGFVRAGKETGARHATLGYEFQLSKRSNLFLFHTELNNDTNGLADFAVNGLGGGRGHRLKASAAGIRHTF